MTNLVKRETIQEKVNRRNEQAKIIEQIIELAKKVEYCKYELSELVRHDPYPAKIEDVRKKLDYAFWREILIEHQLEKFTTSKDLDKILDRIEEKAPNFDFDTVYNTMQGIIGSSDSLATNLIKKVYKNITEAYFLVGNKSSNPIRKDLQKGIQKSFRLTMFYGYKGIIPRYVSSYNSNFNTIVDFERACYLADNKVQPDRCNNIQALTDLALNKGETFVEGPYFNLQVFKNGNVKIDMKSIEVLNTINKWGRESNHLEN